METGFAFHACTNTLNDRPGICLLHKVKYSYDVDLRLHSRLEEQHEQMRRDNKIKMACLWDVKETDMPREEGVCQEAEENKIGQVGWGHFSRL